MIYLGIDNYYDILAARGMMGNGIEEIYTSLSHEDYRIRSFAAQTIQVNYPTEKSFNIAKIMLGSSKIYEREIGAYILGQLGTPNMPFVKDSLPLLYQLFDDSSRQVVSVAISSVGHLWQYTTPSKDNSIINKIINFTKHKSPNIRISSIMTLSSVYNREDIVLVLRNIMANDINTDVQEWAEVALEILLDLE